MALNYLLDPMFQIENTAGKPATDGWLEVYVHGTRTKYYCASNFDGTLHPFKIKLDSLGSNIVLADDGQAYDVYAYNRFGSLLMSRYNVQPGKGGSGSGGIVSELEHWLGGYGPTYMPFPGDNMGHTLGISKSGLQSGGIDYVGNFIDRIETCPYPDGVEDGYIYLKPGLYYVDCIIRYQQDSESLSNTLDEILVYTGYGNANESLAYQFDSTGPEATGNRHNVRVSFVRHVTENEGSILYFAPATPVNWKEAYIQKLQIVKLDGVKGEQGVEGKSAYEVWLDQGNTGTEQDFLDSLQGEQGPQGVQGPAGPQGPVGQQGIQGPVGPQGIQGPAGAAGADGKSAYEIWLDQGNTGTEQDFLDSLEGEQGPQGIQGPVGPQGPTGPVGATGAAGHDGTTPPVVPLVAGANINITESNNTVVIGATGLATSAQLQAVEAEIPDVSGLATKTELQAVEAEIPDVSGLATKTELTQGLAGKQDNLSAGTGIDITNDTVSVDPNTVAMKSDLPSEEEVQFEELDPSAYATKTELTQGLAGKQDNLTAGNGISITNNVISANGDSCLWFLDSDGKIQPRDGKHFEAYGAPSYSQVGQYYFKKAAKVQSNDSGFEIDGLLASHSGSDTPYGDYGTVAKVYTEFAQDPYMGARRGGLVVKSFENSAVHPESRIDMYAGNDSGYGVENYKNKTYVQAVVGSDYVRMRSDDVIRHTGNSDSHAPFVSAQQSDTTKTYVMKPTSTAGVYDLVEESSGGGGGTTYTAGQGIDITNDVISVDPDSVAMKSDLPSEEEVEFEEFNPENFTQQQINALKRVLGVDETVLWTGTSAMSSNPSLTLSESAQNFKFIDIYSLPHNTNTQPIVTRIGVGDNISGANIGTSFTVIGHASGTGVRINNAWLSLNGTSASFTEQKQFSIIGTTVSSGNCVNIITKIVGIGRISNS